MKIRDLMTQNVELIAAGENVQTAARKMLDNDIGFLPIHKNDRLIGVLTDRDIAVRVVAEGRDPSMTAVEEAMTRGAKYCYADEDPSRIADNMVEIGVCRLPVLNRDKRLVGIISIDDITLLRDSYAGNASASTHAERPR